MLKRVLVVGYDIGSQLKDAIALCENEKYYYQTLEIFWKCY